MICSLLINSRCRENVNYVLRRNRRDEAGAKQHPRGTQSWLTGEDTVARQYIVSVVKLDGLLMDGNVCRRGEEND
jgi:hypothetical protein